MLTCPVPTGLSCVSRKIIELTPNPVQTRYLNVSIVRVIIFIACLFTPNDSSTIPQIEGF